MWLYSSVDRASHRPVFAEATGFESRWSPDFLFRPLLSICLKCPYDQVFGIHFFTFSCTVGLPFDILPNFNLFSSTERAFFGTLFPWIYGRHEFSLFQFLVENWSKWRHVLKNTTRIKIIITISAENSTKTGAKVCHVLVRSKCCPNCYYNLNPCCIFENKTSFSPILNEELEQGKLMAALNSGK